MKMGNTLSLALSESNIKSGHHYIILERYKFKLKWEQHQQQSLLLNGQLPPLRGQLPPLLSPQQQRYLISLYLVTDETYPVLSRGWRCIFKIGLNGKPQKIRGFFGGQDQIIVGGGGAAQGLVGGGGAAQGLVGGGGAAQGLVGDGGASQSLFGGGGASQGLVGGGDASQGVVGGGGAAQGFVGGDGQLLGSVTLNCGVNITAPTLYIQTNVTSKLYLSLPY